MHIEIDSRERNSDLFVALDELSIMKNFTYQKSFLEVGDFVCGNIVIERKEATDFVNSIIDGRLSGQIAKMCMNFENRYVIVEGDPYQTRSMINWNSIVGMLTSLLVKYNTSVIYVPSAKECIYAVWSIVKKHSEGGTYDPTTFVKKKITLTDEDIITNMLYQVPNLGIDKARTISEKYKYSLKNLMNADKADLMTIDGIGKVMAERIMSLFER